MKRIFFISSLLCSLSSGAQNLIPIPDTLSGTNFNLNIHPDSVQFLPGRKTYTNAFNQYSYLGPTLIFNKWDSVALNVLNTLPDTSTVHWHGVHVPAIADGGPQVIVLSGNTWSPGYRVLNNASTFWYHPHTHMKTGQQAMRGAAGFIIVRDSTEASLNLPRTYGVDDFPIAIQSQQFDSLNQIDWRGMRDSILLVNGTIDHMLNIPAQVVRLRLLNGSQERNFNFGFTSNKSFYVIGNDGGLLTSPVPVTRIRLSPGERAEILLDVSGMNGQNLYLMSYASEFPQGVQGGIPMPGMGNTMDSPLNGVDFNILKLNIVGSTSNPITTIPSFLVPNSPWQEASANATRNIIITAQNMMSMDGPFYFNGLLYDMNRIDYQIPLNNIEIWSITNQTMVAHPFHIHNVQFFILDRDGITPAPEERGSKDVVMIAPNETVRFITKFEDYADTAMPYMYHCHILMHEDDGMMGQFVVVSPTTGLNDLSTSQSLYVYPNPNSNGELTIKLGNVENQNANLSMFNTLGEELVLPIEHQGKGLLKGNLSGYPTGIYFLKIVTDKQILTREIIIQ
ncbi:MAG TPA: multicopper oxidase domain-containing protein [Bacteroidia bacterium]|nr:multicopper oxidase domain-containing protein [Bacteroidia bacterium]